MFTQTAEKTIRISLPNGLHVRPSQRVVACASEFEAEIWLHSAGMCGHASSTLSLLALGLLGDCTVTVQAKGMDAVEAVERVCSLLVELQQEHA